MNLDVEDMETLLRRARTAGTVDKWADIALEWMKAAAQEISKQRIATAIEPWKEGPRKEQPR